VQRKKDTKVNLAKRGAFTVAIVLWLLWSVVAVISSAVLVRCLINKKYK
jgi:hypothetical protein